MAIQKFGDAQDGLTVLRGREAHVLQDHLSKTGKSAVSQFDTSELDDLQKALDEVRKDGSKGDS